MVLTLNLQVKDVADQKQIRELHHIHSILVSKSLFSFFFIIPFCTHYYLLPEVLALVSISTVLTDHLEDTKVVNETAVGIF